MQEFINGLAYYYRVGGYVMPVLVVSAVLLWYALGYRISAVKRGSKRSVRQLIERYSRGKWSRPRGVIEAAIVRGMRLKQQHPGHLRRYLDDAFAPYRLRMHRHAVLIKTVVASAPLLGLLGTVSGMIETFDSLTDMTLFSQSGGIAGGISQALVTTQLGLAIAIPGLLVSRVLDRRAQQLDMELAQVKDILCSLPSEEK